MDMGDFIEIVGKRKTAAKVFRASNEDEGRGHLHRRHDPLERRREHRRRSRGQGRYSAGGEGRRRAEDPAR